MASMFCYRLNLKKVYSSQRLLTLALLGTLLVNGLGQTAALAVSAKQPASLRSAISPVEVSQTRPADRPSRQIIRRVRLDLSERFNVPQQSLKLVNFNRETWSNGCLGLAPNERCTSALVEGWRIEMTDGQQNWVYRTDLTAQVLRPEPPVDEAAIPADVSEMVLAAIAKQVRVPVATLRIAESKLATWDGCMGIYEPGRFCTQIAISGWQMIVAGAKQSWVYHISEDGDRITQNTTASGSGLVPTFATADESPFGQPEPNIVFRSIEAGGLAGRVTERVLTDDGTLYRQVRQPNQGQAISSRYPQGVAPVIEKRLSKSQVQQFQKLLEDQRFPNLNNLRYLSDAAFADYPTMTLQGLGRSVEYIDLEVERLPVALRSVIQAWNRLGLN